MYLCSSRFGMIGWIVLELGGQSFWVLCKLRLKNPDGKLGGSFRSSVGIWLADWLSFELTIQLGLNVFSLDLYYLQTSVNKNDCEFNYLFPLHNVQSLRWQMVHYTLYVPSVYIEEFGLSSIYRDTKQLFCYE